MPNIARSAVLNDNIAPLRAGLSLPRVVLCCADPLRLKRLKAELDREPGIVVVGAVADLRELAPLAERVPIDVVLAVAPPSAWLAEWRLARPQTALAVILGTAEDDDSLDALLTGAQAILPSAAAPAVIAGAIASGASGLATLPRALLHALMETGSVEPETSLAHDPANGSALTPRELEVLAAMADGASNKAIARRLGISFHTVKFHVAGILGKLDADSRTEAVAKAAHQGLVML